MPVSTKRDRSLGCLIGGAFGDALGVPLTFLSADEISASQRQRRLQKAFSGTDQRLPVSHITHFVRLTAEGLAYAQGRHRLDKDADILNAVHAAYLRAMSDHGCPTALSRKVIAQNHSPTGFEGDFRSVELDPFTLNALHHASAIGEFASNDFKGNGAITRIAPVGVMFSNQPMRAFRLASNIARLTHAYPTASISAGAFAMMIALVTDGVSLETALETTLEFIEVIPDHQETTDAIIYSPLTSEHPTPRADWMGRGWAAQEALAIALHAVAASNSTEQAIMIAIRQSGNSSAIGCLAGQLAGALRGTAGLSVCVEGQRQMERLATELTIE